ncbi:type I-E CRISPR-associated protein Cse1/CasA [Streptomyces violaceusniger]|uniref:type I-E CRISPR-associated protein Cse1/CasA n=1 Tax=Streptomyces violaceusniger TaxID=68280 RepID=UPI003422D2B1
MAAAGPQCWDTAGIKTGAVGAPRSRSCGADGHPDRAPHPARVIIPTGPTLYETLMLNTPVLSGGLDAADRPQWASDERPETPGWASPPDPGGPFGTTSPTPTTSKPAPSSDVTPSGTRG